MIFVIQFNEQNKQTNMPKVTGKRSRRYPQGGVRKRRKTTPSYSGRYAATGAETKFFDTDLDATIGGISNTLEKVNLNIIPQGTTESTRIGRKVVLKKLNVKGIISLPTTATAASTSTVVKVLIIQDKQTNGAAFGATDLWDTDSISSFNNLANSSRFRVLKTKVFVLNSTAGSGRGTTDTLSFGTVDRYFSMDVNFNIPIEFDNSVTTGTVASQRTNSLWFCTQSDTSLSVLNLSTARVRFLDG